MVETGTERLGEPRASVSRRTAALDGAHHLQPAADATRGTQPLLGVRQDLRANRVEAQTECPRRTDDGPKIQSFR
jgi:hypothetical protein